jgi:hypothetical protein
MERYKFDMELSLEHDASYSKDALTFKKGPHGRAILPNPYQLVNVPHA